MQSAGVTTASKARRSPVHKFWTAARTRYSQEQRAAHHIEQQGFTYYLPYVQCATTSGKLRRELLFPGFIFVHIDIRGRWQRLASTRGVASLFMCGSTPTRMPAHEITSLQALEDKSGTVQLRPNFADGDKVRVRLGKLAGLVGSVSMDAAHRCSLLVEILGQPARLQFDWRALEPAA